MRSTNGWYVLDATNANTADVTLPTNPATLFRSDGNISLNIVLGTGVSPKHISVNINNDKITSHSKSAGS